MYALLPVRQCLLFPSRTVVLAVVGLTRFVLAGWRFGLVASLRDSGVLYFLACKPLVWVVRWYLLRSALRCLVNAEAIHHRYRLCLRRRLLRSRWGYLRLCVLRVGFVVLLLPALDASLVALIRRDYIPYMLLFS